jgi:hypothetical protein
LACLTTSDNLTVDRFDHRTQAEAYGMSLAILRGVHLRMKGEKHMANYFWDLGVDWNAVQNASSVSYLSNGLVNTTGPGVAQLATPIWLQVGDTVTFMIYDVTSTAAGLTNLTFSCSSIMADAGVTATAPFSGSTGTPTATSSSMYSTYFEGIYPAWGTGTLTILNNGGYLLTFTVTATVGATTRTFVDDPEMVVGEAPPIKSPCKPPL